MSDTWTTDEPDAFTGKTRIGFVLDRSNSMVRLKTVTIDGFNEWLNVQRNTPGDCDFTLTMFDSKIEMPIRNRPIGVVKNLTDKKYRPEEGGMTALYDAIAHTIKEVDSMMRPGDRALIPILTDGQENDSQEFALVKGGKRRIKELIESYEKKGNWTFTYISASLSAIDDAVSIGMPVANVAQYDATPQGTQGAFMRTATSTAAYRAQSLSSVADFYQDADPGDEDKSSKKGE